MTIRRIGGIVPGLLAALVLCIESAGAGPAPEGWDPANFLSLAEVRPGMRGVGRTVFRGSDIVEFEVEILGVTENPSPRGTMILASLSGQGLEKIGVVAGMSGSPIYVDGKLLGALAFGWSFASEPIAGITPIEEMLRMEARAAAGSRGDAMTGAGMPPGSWERLLRSSGAEALAQIGEMLAAAGGGASAGSIPLASAGFSGAAAELLGRWAEARGFVSVPAGVARRAAAGAEPANDSGQDLRPGSAVAVELMRGDAQLAAIGTLTWRDGDRLWAFGHPMFGLGAAAYPLASADIVTVMPRLSSSFKMGGPVRTVGAITRDYSPGIMGSLGVAPALVPVEIELAFGDRKESIRAEILEAETWTPALAGILALSSVEALGRTAGPSTVRVETRVELKDGRAFETSSVLAGFSPPAAFAGEVARLVGLIHGNPFEPVELSRVRVEGRVEDRVDAAFLQTVTVPPGPHRPGDRLAVALELRNYRGEIVEKRIEIPLPADLPPGSYKLQVSDAVQASRAEEQRAPEAYAPRSLEQLRGLLSESPSLDELVLRIVGPGANPVVAGRELPRLPASLRPAVQSPRTTGRTGVTTGTVFLEERVKGDGVILGAGELTLSIEPPR